MYNIYNAKVRMLQTATLILSGFTLAYLVIAAITGIIKIPFFTVTFILLVVILSTFSILLMFANKKRAKYQDKLDNNSAWSSHLKKEIKKKAGATSTHTLNEIRRVAGINKEEHGRDYRKTYAKRDEGGRIGIFNWDDDSPVSTSSFTVEHDNETHSHAMVAEYPSIATGGKIVVNGVDVTSQYGLTDRERKKIDEELEETMSRLASKVGHNNVLHSPYQPMPNLDEQIDKLRHKLSHLFEEPQRKRHGLGSLLEGLNQKTAKLVGRVKGIKSGDNSVNIQADGDINLWDYGEETPEDLLRPKLKTTMLKDTDDVLLKDDPSEGNKTDKRKKSLSDNPLLD